MFTPEKGFGADAEPCGHFTGAEVFWLLLGFGLDCGEGLRDLGVLRPHGVVAFPDFLLELAKSLLEHELSVMKLGVEEFHALCRRTSEENTNRFPSLILAVITGFFDRFAAIPVTR